MKTLRLLLVLAGLIAVCRANPVPMPIATPRGIPIPTKSHFTYTRGTTMVGETVAVKLQKDVGDVEAVYEFYISVAYEPPRVVYFPLFAAAQESPAAVLARCTLELELNGKPVGPPTPCEPPLQVDGLPAGVSVCWFAADVDSLADDTNNRLVLRARFRQPKISGQFYYVPLISGVDFKDRRERSWNYQLHARTTTRMPRVASPASDYETLGDTVTVYLRNGEIVVLE